MVEMIDGPTGLIELDVTPVHGSKAVGIFCHPHPLYQGTMYNKVVTTAIRALQDASITAVRFNFRGVGQSAGVYAEGIGEVDDLLAVVAYLRLNYPYERFILGGFSFGAYIALKASIILTDSNALVTVGLPLVNFNLQDIKVPQQPWLVVHGMQDDIAPVQAVSTFCQQREHIKFVTLEADHYFHGKLIDLKRIIYAFLTTDMRVDVL